MESNNLNFNRQVLQPYGRGTNSSQNTLSMNNGAYYTNNVNRSNSPQPQFYGPGMVDQIEMPDLTNKRQKKPATNTNPIPYNTKKRTLNINQDNSMVSNSDNSALVLLGNNQTLPTLPQGLAGGVSESSYSSNDDFVDLKNMGFKKGKRVVAPQGKPINIWKDESAFAINPNMTGLQKMSHLSRIFVKQKFELLEMLTGCETENRYKVYAADEGLERVGRPIFKCKEKSGFFARNLLSGDCRPFGMSIIHEEREEDDEASDMFIYLDRPCRFTYMCLNRPEITVTVREGGVNQYIGKVVSDWACCDMLFSVFGADNQLIYNIYGNCCQWGLYFNCPCNACAKIVFQIRNPKGENVGEINKLYSGALKELLTDTDNFCCIFPEGATPEEKSLLLALVLFIDFRYFEQAPAQNGGVV